MQVTKNNALLAVTDVIKQLHITYIKYHVKQTGFTKTFNPLTEK